MIGFTFEPHHDDGRNIASVLMFMRRWIASAGDPAVAELLRVRKSGNFALVREGSVPRDFTRQCCITYGFGGGQITYM